MTGPVGRLSDPCQRVQGVKTRYTNVYLGVSPGRNRQAGDSGPGQQGRTWVRHY